MSKFNPWNNIPKVDSSSKTINFNHNQNIDFEDFSYLARGNGRSYGDVCINSNGSLILNQKNNSIIKFDSNKGVLNCQTGITINEVLKKIVPEGWFLPVVPGTSQVTIGGSIANDIHGKNHHKVGSFGNFLLSFTILRSNGKIVRCSLEENSDLFKATVGGLGLTGLILTAEIKLLKINNEFIESGVKRFSSIDEFVNINSEMEKKYDYTVSWIDFNFSKNNTVRGIYHYGNHLGLNKTNKKWVDKNLAISFPVTTPFSLVNNLSLKILNNFYFFINKETNLKIKNYKSFFFPLDVIKNWNRAYGKNGFYQYQFVVSLHCASEVISLVVQELKSYNHRPALGVLKTFGNIKSHGIISFPRNGITLAIDLQNKGKKTLELLEVLDQIILQFNGKVYPAKDCRMSSTTFNEMYQNFKNFKQFIDPKFSSSFFERIK